MLEPSNTTSSILETLPWLRLSPPVLAIVLAVAFNVLFQQSSATRKAFFPGRLGWAIIPVLSLLVGTGGTMVELLDDTVSLLLPANRDDIAATLASLKVSMLLDGFRGKPPADRDALTDAIVALGEYAVANRETLVELDINPLMALEHGVAVADVLLRIM